MNKMNRVATIIPLFILSIVLFNRCTSRHEPLPAASVKQWVAVPLDAGFEVPAPAGRDEEGEATLELFDDNSLSYSFHIHNLTPGDVLTGAHIHYGNPGSSGAVFINLNPAFTGAGAEGKITGLTQEQVDSLKNGSIYINVHSTQVPAGLVRGQLDKTIELAKDIPLSGLNERPNPVTTTATGVAMIRVTSDKMLYSKVSFSNLEANDTITVSHIHKAGASVSGPVRIFLCNAEADFGTLRITPLADSLYNMLKTDSVYVNAHSRRKPAGLLRGQIR